MSTLKRSPTNLLDDSNSYYQSYDSTLKLSELERPASAVSATYNAPFSYMSLNNSQDSFYNEEADNRLEEFQPSPMSFRTYFDNFEGILSPVTTRPYQEDLASADLFTTYSNPDSYMPSRPPLDDWADYAYLSGRTKSQGSLMNTEPKMEDENQYNPDVVMVSQDSYDVFGHPHHLIQDMSAYQLDNKDFSTPDINLLKPKELMFEYSDDEDEDDDYDVSRLDDVMDMDESNTPNSWKDDDIDDYIKDDYNIRSFDFNDLPQLEIPSPPFEEYIPLSVNPADLEKKRSVEVNDEELYKPLFSTPTDQFDANIERLTPINVQIEHPSIFLPTQDILEKKSTSLGTISPLPSVPSSPLIDLDLDIEDLEKLENPVEPQSSSTSKSSTAEPNELELNENKKLKSVKTYRQPRTSKKLNLKSNSETVKTQLIDDLNSKDSRTIKDRVIATTATKKKTAKISKPTKSSKDHRVKEGKDSEHVCMISNPKTGLPCHKVFSRPYDLIRHQNTIHATKRSFYRCLFCEDDLRRKKGLNPINSIVESADYRSSNFSKENAATQITSSQIIKKIRHGPDAGQEYLSNKTFSRCDALTRHLRFRHGLGDQHVSMALDFAKNNVEYLDN